MPLALVNERAYARLSPYSSSSSQPECLHLLLGGGMHQWQQAEVVLGGERKNNSLSRGEGPRTRTLHFANKLLRTKRRDKAHDKSKHSCLLAHPPTASLIPNVAMCSRRRKSSFGGSSGLHSWWQSCVACMCASRILFITIDAMVLFRTEYC